MYTLIFLAILVFLVNLPDYVKKHLTQKIAVESCEARDNFQLAQWNPITKIEWLRLYPLKKVFMGGLWSFCLYASVRGIFVTVNDYHTSFLWLTIFFWAITLLSVRKVWRYIRLPYHCVPILNHTQTKEELKDSLQGECFEKVAFQHERLRKYFHVLLSENWAVIDGFLISRKAVRKIYFLHENPIVNHVQIKFVYVNGEEIRFTSRKLYANELRDMEISASLHKIAQEVVEKEEAESTPEKKDQAIIYWNMNYKGKFKRTLWFIPVVVVLCFLTPLFMGSFWYLYDVILVVILVWQLRYTYKRMKMEEEKSKEGIDSNVT